MQSNPLWPATRRFPRLVRELRTEVAIVGGGIAGISIAHDLTRSGFGCAVIEKGEIGSGASGASSGIQYYGCGENLTESQRRYGEEKARMLWQESAKAMEETGRLIEKNVIECGYRKSGAIMVARNAEEKNYLSKEALLLSQAGITAQMLDGREVGLFFAASRFEAGLHFPQVSQLHPGIFCSELASKTNLQVFENTPYISQERIRDGFAIRTPEATLKCRQIIFATNMEPLRGGLEKHIMQQSSTIYASIPLHIGEFSKIWPQEKIIWTIGKEYDIIYPMEGRRIVLELFRPKRIMEKARAYYGKSFVVNKQFGDSWGFCPDMLPIAGKLEDGLFAVVALGDQGTTMALTLAKRAKAMVEGKSDPLLEMCSPSRFIEGNS